ncbi:Crp/Fnr family transcriptional regulator [Geobacillus thermodenitrificans]|jgi:CRP/FNR family transcriptional regulator, cyclic AMP receptor protein|uniref:Cyclic AMP receptor protein regulatory protein CRP n=1 Tax=Geobacillus thermodenitrificans (strain NG80-2) TaxID=420246 RepID=A4IT55_GEOTN|nr:Crp/Fnr family transcriptional regulator [Geobacillus thermodenitrificans]ABO68509.1 Cyclic AMP receptor protein regulatory protein CRP [Geobacillus thermodenitrificans NG80-2]
MNLRYKWTPFLAYGQRLELKKNTVVYRQGEDGKGFYYLDQGSVKISTLSSNGFERVIDYVPVGTLLGEHGACRGTYLTTAITTAPTILYYFSDEALTRVCQDHPEAALLFSHSHIYKVRLLAEIIAYMDCSVEQQMAHFLLKLVDIHGKETIPIDQASLARYIGTSRITVNKVMQKWRKQGLIRCGNSIIYVLDTSRLKKLLPCTENECLNNQRSRRGHI